MAKYQELNHMDEMEQNKLDEYLSANDKGSANRLDIIHLFGKEKLENIQSSLSKATGLAFVTVDFKGEPITKSTSFSKFCQKVRSYPAATQRCKFSDAFGSIQAAVTKKTNVYFCPCGLLEVAIPIIVRGHYLGGFVGGQIRCKDAPDSISRLDSVIQSPELEEISLQYQDLFDETPVFSYEKFLNIANLVFLVINQLSENEMNQQIQEDILKKRMKKSMQKILTNYKTEHEDSVQRQMETLVAILRRKDFDEFYHNLAGIIDEIYHLAGDDSARLIKIFNYLGQSLLDTRTIYDEGHKVMDIFPINEGLILERKTSELWLFRVMDYLFQQNSISRYPVLENIFRYIKIHIKEEITLSDIIENCAISQGYLSRIFRKQFHISVTRYLHMKKIHLAKGYFYFTEDSIAEVAFRLGYNESSYFSKVFKKYEKMTVKQYKNKTRKNTQ